ncbi:MAG: hypothetical protein NTX50_09695 [Candidatus Sumerlaeota bacterium]|nr:hypothetical protein [Candidatus Sumerlaeota bacterium]
MPIQQSLDVLTQEQIVDIIQANAELYKNEPDFAKYIAELSAYLLDNHYEGILKKKSQIQAGVPQAGRSLSADIPKALTDTQLGNFARARKALREVYDTHFDKKRCPNCGVRVTGTQCVACGMVLV